nr:hypothetical protein [Solirubrobacterales bacterium]
VQVRSPTGGADPTKSLPFTGGQALMIAIIGLLLLALGTLLAVFNRERERRAGASAAA